jgi:hypothetical protein
MNPSTSPRHISARQTVALIRTIVPNSFRGIVPFDDTGMIGDPNWRTRARMARGFIDDPFMDSPPPPGQFELPQQQQQQTHEEDAVLGQDVLQRVPRMRDRLGVTERERANRRRRREAIVINEGGGPVTQGDIIQRPVGSS